ncbi:hypothetical protein M436DRAFT_68375 [Aureobasidium namibiae CBS 147.97]|uniref:NAD(+) ADP-ribosyltransferase n=1 Tax=Aureobasidium namibiae CBS 147.97 TaxID=1043004 RepID=A0A074W993_9PEZI|nr:uncharacterized protein M436DRAFT_68375 [Aureobasidium namibiae CBS 147.97]KEQ68164.1 hypothetical protein M436DRAFT_68375 [Aureobasidium namibiae CBS 147.97]
MTKSPSGAQTSSKPGSGNLKTLGKALPPKRITRSSVSPSSVIIKTNGSSSHAAKTLRVGIEAEDDSDNITINKITINEIKEEHRQREVPVPNRKNKPFLLGLLVETRRKQSGIRDEEGKLAELKMLLVKHGNPLGPELIKAIEKAYIVPKASTDQINSPAELGEASRQDRVRCSRTKQLKASKAFSEHMTSAKLGSSITRQASVQMAHQIADDGDSASSATHKILVDPNNNIPYDAMLYCKEPHDNVDKFFHLELIPWVTQILAHDNPKSYSLVTKSGRSGTDGQQRSYAYGDLEGSVTRFEKIFREKTGLEWKTRDKKIKGKGYSCSNPCGQVKNETISETQDQTYRDDGTSKIRFSSPSKSKGD